MNGNQDTTRPPEGYAGHEPLPTVQGSKPFIDCSEHVEVVYSHVYRCQHCGYVPPEFGCNPKMREHLKEAHGIEEPLDAWWWMSGYHDNRLKRELTELAALRARLAELEAKPEPPTDYAMALDSLRDMMEQNAALRAENARLRGWKAQQLAVEASWDPQAIGRLIGVPLGGDIRRAIKPAITALRAENERLMKLLAKADRAMMATGIDHAYGHIRKEIASALGNAQEARDV